MDVRLYCLSVITLIVATGCQPGNRQMMASLPAPTFDGPHVALAAPLPPPTVVAAGPIARPARSGGSQPVGWVPAVAARPWRWIVVHHSATAAGGAKAFDQMHRGKGWDELGYHFVIGNGSDTADGAIEVGSRWPKQKYGAHCKTPDNQYNDFGIGICLVGNFDESRPTAAQMKSLAKLTAYLMKTYRIPASRVIGHGDAKPTDCPGNNFSIASLRRMATSALAASDGVDAYAQAKGDQ